MEGMHAGAGADQGEGAGRALPDVGTGASEAHEHQRVDPVRDGRVRGGRVLGQARDRGPHAGSLQDGPRLRACQGH